MPYGVVSAGCHTACGHTASPANCVRTRHRLLLANQPYSVYKTHVFSKNNAVHAEGTSRHLGHGQYAKQLHPSAAVTVRVTQQATLIGRAGYAKPASSVSEHARGRLLRVVARSGQQGCAPLVAKPQLSNKLKEQVPIMAAPNNGVSRQQCLHTYVRSAPSTLDAGYQHAARIHDVAKLGMKAQHSAMNVALGTVNNQATKQNPVCDSIIKSDLCSPKDEGADATQVSISPEDTVKDELATVWNISVRVLSGTQLGSFKLSSTATVAELHQTVALESGIQGRFKFACNDRILEPRLSMKEAGLKDGAEVIMIRLDGHLVATCSQDGVKLWQVENMECLQVIEPEIGHISCLAFSPNARHIATGDTWGSIQMWDLVTGTREFTLAGHSGVVSCAAFSPDGRLLVTGCDDYTAKIWDVRSGECLNILCGHGLNHDDDIYGAWPQSCEDGHVSSVAFSPDGCLVATGSLDCTVKLWTVESGLEEKAIEQYDGPVFSVAFSPCGKMVLIGTYYGVASLWDVDTICCVRTFGFHKAKVHSAVFSPDGMSVATGSYDCCVKLWDAMSGECLKSINCRSEVNCLAFSPDGETLATVANDGLLQFWGLRYCDEEVSEPLFTYKHHSALTAIAFDPTMRLDWADALTA